MQKLLATVAAPGCTCDCRSTSLPPHPAWHIFKIQATRACCAQVDLGFHHDEQSAAKAHDRAVIIHGMHDGQKSATNFDTSTYISEMDVLTAISPDAFAAAMAQEE